MDQEAWTLIVALAVVSAACDRTPKDAPAVDAASVTSANAREVVPPVASFNATPVAQLADAANLDGQPPFEQAKAYEANGQLWMARLVLEKKALGEGGTKDEAELLARVCQEQGDEACLDACSTKLGRKIKLDGGAARAPADAGREHAEPDTDLARTRDLVLKLQYEPARKALEPKVLDGKATREEIRLLREVCKAQNDRMCVALCDSKLK